MYVLEIIYIYIYIIYIDTATLGPELQKIEIDEVPSQNEMVTCWGSARYAEIVGAGAVSPHDHPSHSYMISYGSYIIFAFEAIHMIHIFIYDIICLKQFLGLKEAKTAPQSGDKFKF